jgi:hypothetical protein
MQGIIYSEEISARVCRRFDTISAFSVLCVGEWIMLQSYNFTRGTLYYWYVHTYIEVGIFIDLKGSKKVKYFYLSLSGEFYLTAHMDLNSRNFGKVFEQVNLFLFPPSCDVK